MAYLLATLLAIVSAMVVVLTKFEADDSVIRAELLRAESMILSIDSYINTHLELGESLGDISFAKLDDNGVLLQTISITRDTTSPEDELLSNIKFPKSEILWQVIPNKDSINSYKLLVDFTNDWALMSKAKFSESFLGTQYCEKKLFGDFNTLLNSYDTSNKDDFIDVSGTNEDGLFVCTVYK